MSEGRLKLATWNIKHGAREDGYRGDPAAVSREVVRLDADIVALQEVDNWALRSGLKDMAKLAAKASGMRPEFGRTMRFYGFASYGNALLARGEFEEVSILKLQGARRFNIHGHRVPLRHEHRNAILARVRIGETAVSVAATHLSTQSGLRKQQLPAVLDGLLDLPGPHVLLGDLNMSREEALPFLAGRHMELVEGRPTFPASEPRRSIDHIALRGLKWLTAAVRYDPPPVSDHRALLAEVE